MICRTAEAVAPKWAMTAQSAERTLLEIEGSNSREGLFMAIVEVHDLTKRFDDVVAVDGLSFELREGKVTVFLGPNGPARRQPCGCCWGWWRPPPGGRPSWAGPTPN